MTLPVNRLKPELGDFAGTEAVHRKKHQDGTVPYIPWTIGVQAGQQALDLRPCRSRGEAFLRKDPWSLHGICKGRLTPAVLACIAEKSAQRVGHVSDCKPGPSVATTLGQKRIDVPKANSSERPLLRPVPTQKLANVPGLALDCGDRQTACVLPPRGEIRHEFAKRHGLYWLTPTAQEAQPGSRHCDEPRMDKLRVQRPAIGLLTILPFGGGGLKLCRRDPQIRVHAQFASDP